LPLQGSETTRGEGRMAMIDLLLVTGFVELSAKLFDKGASGQ
jgi:hypothetical protein